MSEPGRIRNSNLQNVRYTTYEGGQGEAVVRRNRSVEETQAQYNRIYDRNPNLINENPSRYLQLADAYTRTLRAMSATGRENPYGTMYRATRRNNRR